MKVEFVADDAKPAPALKEVWVTTSLGGNREYVCKENEPGPHNGAKPDAVPGNYKYE